MRCVSAPLRSETAADKAERLAGQRDQLPVERGRSAPTAQLRSRGQHAAGGRGRPRPGRRPRRWRDRWPGDRRDRRAKLIGTSQAASDANSAGPPGGAVLGELRRGSLRPRSRSAARRAAARARAAATSSSGGSTTSRYAFSFGSVPDGRTTRRSPSRRSTSTSGAGRSVVQPAGGAARSRSTAASRAVGLHPHRHPGGRVHAVLAGQRVEPVGQARGPRPSASAARSQASTAAAMPSLSRTASGSTQ